MTSMEDLLRATFAEHEPDMDGVPLRTPAPAPRRPGRLAVVLAGAAAAAAVLIGTTLAVGAHRPAPAPAAPSGTLQRFVPAPVTSAGNRTGGFLTWAPTWTPAPETGRDILPTLLQVRYYGWEDGTFAAVAVGRGDCKALARPSGLTTAFRWDALSMPVGEGPLCRALPGGGSVGVVIRGVDDPSAQASRLIASIRTGRHDEVALPVSLPAGSVITRLGTDGVFEARTRWQGNITTHDGTDLYIGPPPEPFLPNKTVNGRRLRVDTYPSVGTMVRLELSPTVWVNLIAHDYDRTVALGASLRLGPIPDYPWSR
jgi:hypothetical protein